MVALDDRMVPFENSDNENKDNEDLGVNKGKKSFVELPDEKIVERNTTPPERSKTQLKYKIPALDLDRVGDSRLDFLAKTDAKKLEFLEKRKQEMEMASCTFMPNSSSRKGNSGITKDFVKKLSKPKVIDKYASIREDNELKGCTFMPKTNKPKKKRAKTVKPLEVKPVEEPAEEPKTTQKKVDEIIKEKPEEKKVAFKEDAKPV